MARKALKRTNRLHIFWDTLRPQLQGILCVGDLPGKPGSGIMRGEGEWSMDRVIRLCALSEEYREVDSSKWFDEGMPAGVEVSVPVCEENLKTIVLWGAWLSGIAAATRQECAFDVRLRFCNDGLNKNYFDMDAKSLTDEVQKAVGRDESLLLANRHLAREIILAGQGFFGGTTDVAHPWKQEDDLIAAVFAHLKRIEAPNAVPARRRVGQAAASVGMNHPEKTEEAVG